MVQVSYHGVPDRAYEVFVNALTSRYLEQGLIIPSLEDHNPAGQSVSLSVCPSVCLSVCPPASGCLSACLWLSVCLPLTVCLTLLLLYCYKHLAFIFYAIHV